jgi:hypothetical protein
MQLHVARLCLDCDEVHDRQMCPVCGSESFAYISRWVAAPERRRQPRAEAPQETAEAYRQLLAPERPPAALNRWMKRGVFGLAAVSIAGWVLQRRSRSSEPPRKNP